MKPKVAITTCRFDLYGPAVKKLAESCDIVHVNHDEIYSEKDLIIRLVDGIEGVIAGAEEPFTEHLLFNYAPKLRVISRLGVGTDNIDLDAARVRGIKVFITPKATTDAVAEHTLALTLAIAKRIGFPIEKETGKSGNEVLGTMLRGKTVGIIGLGRIGTRVAELFSAFGCNILFYDPQMSFNLKATPMGVVWRATKVTELISQSDIITLHAPGQEKPILGKDEILNCKKGAIIINTARSSLIDEKSLCAALELGYVSGAGLDVVDAPRLFKKFPQVIITPHVASYTYESRLEMEDAAVKNLITGLKGCEI